MKTPKSTGKHLAFFIICILLSIGIMGIIFYFSAQNGLTSSNSSGRFSKIIIKILTPVFPDALIDFIRTYVRKIAHFTSYFGLGLTTGLAMHEWLIINRPENVCRFKYYLIPFAVCVLYAISDEIHQIYIPGRDGKPADVCLDSSGVILAVLIVWVITILFKRHSSRSVFIL